MLRASDVNSRGPKTLFSVKFVLRLPHNTVAIVTTLALVKTSLALENVVTVQDKVSALVSLSRLLIFYRIVHRRYVGSADFDKSEIIADVETELSSLKLETRVRGQTHCISPDELYQRYQNFIPLLPDDTHDWSFRLVVLFLNALPVTLKELIIAQEYKPPRFSELTTTVLQQQALDILREKAVKAKYTFEQEKHRIKTMVNSFNNLTHRNPPRQTIYYYFPPADASVLHYGRGSMVEQTIVNHQPRRKEKMVVTKNGVDYPSNPESGYVSKWPITFHRCLGCGQEGHMFNACSQRENKNTRSVY